MLLNSVMEAKRMSNYWPGVAILQGAYTFFAYSAEILSSTRFAERSEPSINPW